MKITKTSAQPAPRSDEHDLLSGFVGRLYYNEGLSLARAGRFDMATTRLEEAANLCASNSAPLIILAKIAFLRGDIAGCRSYLDRCARRQDADAHQIATIKNAIAASIKRDAQRKMMWTQLRQEMVNVVHSISAFGQFKVSMGAIKHRLVLLIAIILVWLLAALSIPIAEW